MTSKKKCRLCGQIKELQLSHIIPSFVFKWLKETSVTGRIRLGETPNKRVQDGHKMYLLCRACEQRFSNWENIFAKEMFLPFNQGKLIKPYGSWFLKFSVSISWRVLNLFRDEAMLKHFPESLLPSVDMALNTWKEFLLDTRPNPSSFKQHVLPIGLIGDTTDPNMPSNINRYVLRSIDMDVPCNENSAFIYVKMPRFFLIGFIKMPRPNNWHDIRIQVKGGTLIKKRRKLPQSLADYIYIRARRQKKVQQEMSARQWDRISDDYRKNIDNFTDSEMFKAITQDSILFGEDAFDE